MVEAKEEMKKTKKQKTVESKEPGQAKVKLSMTLEEDHPLVLFQAETKNRGLKNIDLAEVVSQGLSQLPEDFWSEKLKEITPLEYRINMALANPEMREKLTHLLENGMANQENLPI